MQTNEYKISSSPIGTVIFGVTHRPEPRIDFLLREETAFINQLTTAKIPFRVRLFKRNDIAIIVVMFQLGTTSRLYETFWNYYEEGCGEGLFRLISNQDDIAVHLYGDSGSIEKSILMGNIFKGFFKAAETKIRIVPYWSAEQFQKELDELRIIYPSKEALWEALK